MIKSFLTTEKEFKNWFQQNFKTTLVLDVETDGLRLGCELKGFSLCSGKSACYVNLDNNSEFDKILNILRIYLEKETILLIGHNLSFDLRVLKECGITYTGKIYDTQVASHLLNENKSCALKEIVKRKKFKDYKDAIEFKEAVVDGYSSKRFLNYAINDSMWTWDLYELTKPLLTKQGLDKLFYSIELPFQFVLVDMYLNGVKIDTKKLQKFDNILTKEREKAIESCVESLGMKMYVQKNTFDLDEVISPVNFNSSKQLAGIIENALRTELPYTKPTKNFPIGQPSTAAEALEPLKDRHPFIKHLLRYRKAEKLLNTFIRPLYELIDKDGRLRTSYNNCIPRTGRLSSSNPNCQNIPKHFNKEDDIVNVRELFISEKGKVFIRADYDLQEMRQLANVTRDKNLIDVLNANYDIHLYSANSCLGLGLSKNQLIKTNPNYEKLKKKYKKERHIGKNGINFPVIFGSTKFGVARSNNVSKEEAQKWIDGFFRIYPDVKKSIKDCKQELYRNHFVRNYFGRKRRFGEIDDHAIRQAWNFKIQGMCADLLRKVMVRIKQWIMKFPEWNAKMVLTVHDELIIEVDELYADLCAAHIKRIMENAVNLPVKFITDIKICSNYGG